MGRVPEHYGNPKPLVSQYDVPARRQPATQSWTTYGVVVGAAPDGQAERPEERRPEGQADEREAADTVDVQFETLNRMIGLRRVKDEMSQLIRFVRVQEMRRVGGLGTAGMSLHSVYMGAPGTGKTTVARIYARMLRSLGLLSKGHLVEIDRAGLIAGYVGQTTVKTNQVIDEALGGVLFIDEAYALVPSDGHRNDFGEEAVAVLTKRMEDHRSDLAVIVAGYTDPMRHFLESNPGLKSRFLNVLHFEDYDPGQLREIFLSFCAQDRYVVDDDALRGVDEMIVDAHVTRSPSFGNARFCRNLFQQLIRRHAGRIGGLQRQPTQDELMLITMDDVAALRSDPHWMENLGN